MNRLQLRIVCLFFLGFVSVLSAQPKDLEKANAMYKNFAYVDAIKIYERIAKKGFLNQELLERLGNSYYYNADYPNALPWYEKLFTNDEYKDKIKPEYYYRYAQVLKTSGKYDESNRMMDKFVEMTASIGDTRALLYTENKDYQTTIEHNSGRFELNPTSVNTENSEYGTAFYGDKVVFAGTNQTLFKPVATWTGEGFYDLYEAKRDSIALSQKSSFSSVLNTKFNESTAVFTKDGNTVYFTRNNYINKKVGMDSENTILLKIFRATKTSDGSWGNIIEMPFNSNIHNVAHPALSPDEKYLYFASDMKGTLGSSDIYRVEILKDGYGKPENLGATINTTGRESFPFVSADNVLYYSSDGFPGLGGLDIFAVKFFDNGTTSKPINIGKPGNSSEDDFCFVIDRPSNVGFLTSNRPGGKGKDDIYSFYERTPLQFVCSRKMKGIVKDAETGMIISDAKVSLSDKKYDALLSKNSDKDGNFEFLGEKLGCKEPYFHVKGEKDGYETAEVQVNATPEGDLYCEIKLKPRVIKVTKDSDLAKVLNIDNIYFDLDKSDIRYDASVQLAKILEVMKEYPKMVVDIRSHTDSRASHRYNMSLSDRRAKSTVKWLIDNGIEKHRLTGKGYGESQLVNECADGVPCTEEQHQANRRSEFIIMSL